MAVVNTKSAQITNADASPRVPNNEYISKGQMFESVGTVEIAAADDDGSVYRMCRVPSNARISSVHFASDAITGATSADIGVYRTAADGGAVVVDNIFCSALDISSGKVFADQTYQATATNIAVLEKRIWDLCSVSADPMSDYDICVTMDTVGSAAGTLSLIVRYTV